MDSDSSYKTIFDMTVDKYLERYCNQLHDSESFNKDRAKKICLEYVLEECAVLRIWPELQCQYEVYPNLHNEAIQETRSRFILEKKLNLLYPLRLKFHNIDRLILPQKFHLLESSNKHYSQQMAS